jgi:ABC-type antimicrobial peptide transport system permease subunit
LKSGNPNTGELTNFCFNCSNDCKFIVYTDNNPLCYLQTAKLGATEMRWFSQLAQFDFEVKYRSGRSNVNADVLSRTPLNFESHVSQIVQYFFAYGAGV